MKKSDVTMLGPRKLRAVAADDGTAMPYEEADAAFKTHWAQARLAYLTLIESVSGHWVKDLIRPSRSMKAADIRRIRNDVQQIATRANALVVELEAALDVMGRANRRPIPTTPEENR